MLATYSRRIRRSLEGCRPKLSFGLCLFEDGFCWDFFGFLISLPFLDRWVYHPEEIMDQWRIYHMERSVWFWWGERKLVVHLPWELVHIRSDVQRADGSWVPYVGSWETNREPDGRHMESHPYRYVLRSGEVQERIATIYVDRMEWRQKWLRWCPLFALVRKSINIEFNEEVGERSGSWKGGCIGTGYTMKRGETPLQTLQRMERERDFR